MDRWDRLVKLHRVLAARRTPIERTRLVDRLECSPATLTRDISTLRERFSAPLEHVPGRGYLYTDRAFEMPGLWFTPAELHALLAAHSLLRAIDPGLLEDHIAPLRDRIEKILRHKHAGDAEVTRRVRILQAAGRDTDLKQFQNIAHALIKRRRLRVLYHGRARDQTTERTLSPQRLVYYRDNWYLDGWCHLRRALRTFSLDRLHLAEVLAEPCREIADATLDRHVASAYGIFAGPARHTAILRFTKERAKWVADEHWYPQQQSRVLPDGGLELRVPYGRPEELVMDILYGPDVEVVAPRALRHYVAARLAAATEQYREKSRSDQRRRPDPTN